MRSIEYYLNVGYNRRTGRSEDNAQAMKRRVMGRKGIGKLAPFGICQEVEVISAGGPQTDRGRLRKWLIWYLTSQDILNELVRREWQLSYPIIQSLVQRTEPTLSAPGTKLILRRFDRRRVPAGEDINRQLGRAFWPQSA